MNISITTKNDACSVKVSGELDRDTISDNLVKTVNTDEKSLLMNATTIKLDIAEVERVDTAGLAWLLNAIRDLKTQSRSVSVLGIPQKLTALAGLSNANDLIATSEIANDA